MTCQVDETDSLNLNLKGKNKAASHHVIEHEIIIMVQVSKLKHLILFQFNL